MIQKIQTLQKRLISKTEEVVERDLLIQEKEKLYVELKNILARQPGPEVAEQLSTYQANMREKNKQMKSMASELNVYQAQVCSGSAPGSCKYAIFQYLLPESSSCACSSSTSVVCLPCSPIDSTPRFAFPSLSAVCGDVLQANEYKYEIERLTMELSDMKRRYFVQKRKELGKPGSLSGKDVMKLPAIANPSQTRYMGGGFSLATQP